MKKITCITLLTVCALMVPASAYASCDGLQGLLDYGRNGFEFYKLNPMGDGRWNARVPDFACRCAVDQTPQTATYSCVSCFGSFDAIDATAAAMASDTWSCLDHQKWSQKIEKATGKDGAPVMRRDYASSAGEGIKFTSVNRGAKSFYRLSVSMPQ